MAIVRSKGRPILVDQSVENSDITPNAFRVYVHLLRLEISNPDEDIEPQAIADHCFQRIRQESRMGILSAALAELKGMALLEDDDESEVYRQALEVWYKKMTEAYKTLSAKEKQAIQNWESEFVDGSGEYGTSDWPGWEKHVGKKPVPPAL